MNSFDTLAVSRMFCSLSRRFLLRKSSLFIEERELFVEKRTLLQTLRYPLHFHAYVVLAFSMLCVLADIWKVHHLVMEEVGLVHFAVCKRENKGAIAVFSTFSLE